MNGLQDRTPYYGCPVGNIPDFMPLDNILNRDILNSLHFHCVLSHFLLDREVTDKEERNMRFSLSTPKEIPSLERIIQDVDLALKAL